MDNAQTFLKARWVPTILGWTPHEIKHKKAIHP